MATGLTSAEVAEQLDMPVRAIREQLDAAITRLGARSRLEALIIAIRRGLIDLPPADS